MDMRERPKVLIAEDNAILRYTLQRLLDGPFSVVAAVGDGLGAVQAVAEYEPDIVLLDISLPVLNGFQAMERIIQARPCLKIVMVTSHAEEAYVEQAFRRGAQGYVLKGRSADLIKAIRTVMAGQQCRPPKSRLCKTIAEEVA